MGYQTAFTVKIRNVDPAQADTIRELFEDVTGYPFISDGFLDCVELALFAKWYDWENNIKAISKDSPAWDIYITGEGEEGGDLWHARARAGNLVVKPAEVVYPEITDDEVPAITPEQERKEVESAIRADVAKRFGKDVAESIVIGFVK